MVLYPVSGGENKMRKLTAYEALMKLNGLYVRFLTKPQKRRQTLKTIKYMTAIVCTDKRTLDSVKQRAQTNLERYRGML